ncbi:MAG: type IV secretory system conjugative DNA transfer family protein [Pseudomonadota bacterium]
MSFPFGTIFGPRAIDPKGARIVARSLDSGAPIFAPPGHSCTYAPNGAGKTTSVAMPGLLSFIASEPEKGVLVSDPKDGEIAAQAVPMLQWLGRKVAVIDDFNVRPELRARRVALNAFGAPVSTFERDPQDLLYANELVSQSLIEEPPDQDQRNFYFRQSPRTLIEFGISAALKRSTALTTPGAVSVLLSDIEMLLSFAEIEAEEGDPALQAQARSVLEMKGHEHFAMHVGEAKRALRQWGPGSRLAEAGSKATVSHEDLIREGYVIFLVGPQALMSKLGPYYALHLGAFTQALYQNIGSLRVIADEYTNSPLKSFLGQAMTTVRAFGGEFHLIAQSRSEVLRKYGQELTETIEDNCITTQWLGFGLKEAERVSKAMGEQHAVATGLSGDTVGLKAQTNLSLIKQAWMSPAELMAMPKGIQLIHIKGLGFFVAATVSQADIAPYNALLADNPLEGGRLQPDTKIRFVTPKARGGRR